MSVLNQDVKCPACENGIETLYCKKCNETVFIKPIKTTIVNIRESKYDIFIGRRNVKYHWGNPFTHLDVPTRAKIRMNSVNESMQAFRDWLLGIRYADVEPERRRWVLENMEASLKGKVLGCFCKPKKCHGDVYVELLNSGNIQKFL